MDCRPTDRLAALGALAEKGMTDFVCADARVDVGAHLVEALGVGTQRNGSLLGAAHFGGGDHLHRLGDLGGVLDRLDAPANV